MSEEPQLTPEQLEFIEQQETIYNQAKELYDAADDLNVKHSMMAAMQSASHYIAQTRGVT